MEIGDRILPIYVRQRSIPNQLINALMGAETYGSAEAEQFDGITIVFVRVASTGISEQASIARHRVEPASIDRRH